MKRTNSPSIYLLRPRSFFSPSHVWHSFLTFKKALSSPPVDAIPVHSFTNSASSISDPPAQKFPSVFFTCLLQVQDLRLHAVETCCGEPTPQIWPINKKLDFFFLKYISIFAYFLGRKCCFQTLNYLTFNPVQLYVSAHKVLM